MKRSSIFLVALAAAVLAASLPVLAASKEKVRLDRSATIGGAVLPPGEYRVELAPSLETVTLFSGRRAIVTARCKVGLAQGRVYGDAIHFAPGAEGSEVVTKLVFSGSRLSIEMLPPAKDESPIAKADGR